MVSFGEVFLLELWMITYGKRKRAFQVSSYKGLVPSRESQPQDLI
jgi:hypothetical protein